MSLISFPLAAGIEQYPRYLISWEFAGILPICLIVFLFLTLPSRVGKDKNGKGRVFLYLGLASLGYTFAFLIFLANQRSGWQEGVPRDIFDVYVSFVAVFASALGAGSIVRASIYFADADIEKKQNQAR